MERTPYDKKRILAALNGHLHDNYVSFSTGGKFAYPRLVIQAIMSTMNTYGLTLEEIYELIEDEHLRALS